MNLKEALCNLKDKLDKKDIEDSYIKAKLLLLHILNKDESFLIINKQYILSDKEEKEYLKYSSELLSGKPIQYITNKQYFYGQEFYVNPYVLIPQPDTEILIEEAIKIAKEKLDKNAYILDLCTGSGAIAICLKKNLVTANIEASDISEKALEVAKINEKNILSKNSSIVFYESDIFSSIPSRKYDMIVSNPPYIKTNEIENLPKDVKAEPYIALDGGEDGFLIYDKILEKSKAYLKNDGYLLLEIGYDQKEKIVEKIEKKGYTFVKCVKDLSGNDRVVICKK